MAFVVVFLAQVWPPADVIRPLSLFAYYQPQDIVQRGASATAAMVLAAVTAAGLAAAIAVFQRRDLS